MAGNTRKVRAITDLLDQIVVLDMQGTMIVIGRLVRIAVDAYVVEDADLHDCHEGHSGKELYVLNACKFGLRANRRKVYIPRRDVVAMSALDDVVTE